MYLALQPRSKLAPDVILCVGSPGGKALQQTTKTVPIVSIQVAEPVAQGFVQGLRVRVATLFQHSPRWERLRAPMYSYVPVAGLRRGAIG